ncbi:MAG: hypothetical protein V8S58_06025 [Lachnospiraceae bacterium]
MGKKGAQGAAQEDTENKSAAYLIWLSDEGNALEFWKLHANAFGLFPTQEGKTGGISNRLSFEDGKTGKNREIAGGALSENNINAYWHQQWQQF